MDRRMLKESARQSVLEARGPVKRVTLILVLCAAALILAEWGLGALAERSASGSHYLSQTLSAQSRSYAVVMLVSLVFQFLLVMLWAGYCAFSLQLTRDEEIAPGVLLEGFRLWGRVVLLHLYTALLRSLWAIIFSMPVSYVLSALFLAGTISEDLMFPIMMVYAGLVMFIVAYRYRMAWRVMLDAPEKPIRQVVNEAKAINMTHRGQLFLMDLSFVPWGLLCILTCGVLLIWKLPYVVCTYSHAYRYMLEDYGIRQQRMEQLLAEQQERFRQNRFM